MIVLLRPIDALLAGTHLSVDRTLGLKAKTSQNLGRFQKQRELDMEERGSWTWASARHNREGTGWCGGSPAGSSCSRNHLDQAALQKVQVKGGSETCPRESLTKVPDAAPGPSWQRWPGSFRSLRWMEPVSIVSCLVSMAVELHAVLVATMSAAVVLLLG